MAPQPRFGTKEARERAQLLRSLGYEFVREASHGYQFRHPDFDKPLKVPKTPSDNRTGENWLREVKARHPEAFERPKSRRPKTKRRGPGSTAAWLAAEAAKWMDAFEARAWLEANAGQAPPADVDAAANGPASKPECIECGRPWLSDLNHAGRQCPQCGGDVA